MKARSCWTAYSAPIRHAKVNDARRLPSRWFRMAPFALLLLGALVAGAPSAEAHAVLLATSPVDGSVLGNEPPQVALRFNEAVSLTPQSIQLLDAAGHPVRVGKPEHPAGKGDTAAADLTPGLHDGTYVVSWRVVSADAHVVSGAFQFSIGGPSRTVAATGRRPSQVAPVLKTAGAGIAYLGLVATIGGTVFLCFLLPPGPAPRRARRVVWTALTAILLGTLAVLFAQYPYSTGEPITSAFSAESLRATVSTGIGQALLARVVVVGLLAVAVGFLVRGRTGAAARRPLAAEVAAGTCLLALPLTWTLTDHSRTGEQVWLAVPVASVHLLAAALWLGGLIALAACAIGAAPDVPADGADGAQRLRSVAYALPRFSRLALPSFAVIVATGLYQTWRQVGTFPALRATDFGHILLVKLAGVLVIAALAWRHRRFVRSELSRPSLPARGWRSLRRSLAVEALLGVAVLSVATVLVNTAPARTSYAPPVRAKIDIAAAQTHTRMDGGHVELRLTPAKQGLNVADIYLVAKDGSLVAVPGIGAQLVSSANETGAEAIKVSAAEPGHYVASTVSIPYAGKWLLQLDIRTSEFDETPVLIRFRAH